MDNKISQIMENQLLQLKKQFSEDKSIWVAEIDGNNIKDWASYAHAIEKAMQFPTPCDKSYDVYLDWIRDLMWLKSSAFVLIIQHYNSFMAEDTSMKAEIIDDFKEIILPWWGSEVEQHVVNGKAKPFNVYLVD